MPTPPVIEQDALVELLRALGTGETGGRSVSQLSEQLGISRFAVTERLRRLKSEGRLQVTTITLESGDTLNGRRMSVPGYRLK